MWLDRWFPNYAARYMWALGVWFFVFVSFNAQVSPLCNKVQKPVGQREVIAGSPEKFQVHDQGQSGWRFGPIRPNFRVMVFYQYYLGSHQQRGVCEEDDSILRETWIRWKGSVGSTQTGPLPVYQIVPYTGFKEAELRLALHFVFLKCSPSSRVTRHFGHHLTPIQVKQVQYGFLFVCFVFNRATQLSFQLRVFCHYCLLYLWHCRSSPS